jgi:hypothetical protein
MINTGSDYRKVRVTLWDLEGATTLEDRSNGQRG